MKAILYCFKLFNIKRPDNFRMNKKTVVFGASPNPSRYSYLAVNRLLAHGHDVIPIGEEKEK